MESNFKPAVSVNEFVPIMDKILVCGTSKQSVLIMSNFKASKFTQLDKDSTFVWSIAGYGEQAIQLDSKLSIGTEILVDKPPTRRIEIESNLLSMIKQSQLVEEMPTKELQEEVKKELKREIKEYFVMTVYEITGYIDTQHINNKKDSTPAKNLSVVV